VLGDLFDFAYKANLRNVRLLEGYVRDPARARAASNLAAGGIVLGMLALLGAVVAGVLAVVSLVWQALSSAG
jgi:hypothetical protein